MLAPSPAAEIAGNLLIPLAALYFLAGLSIICHFARKWFRARILRVGLYGLAIYFRSTSESGCSGSSTGTRTFAIEARKRR